MRGIIKNIHNLTYDTNIYNILLDNEINFKSGQFMKLKLSPDDVITKPYSIASPGCTTNEIEFAIKIYDDGLFTSQLNKKRIGDHLYLNGPLGDFYFNKSSNPNVVFISGGSGISTNRSIYKYIIENNLPYNIKLVYSVKSVNDIIFHSEISYFSDTFNNFNFFISVTQNAIGWNGHYGRIDKEVLLDEIPNLKSNFYIVGTKNFVNNVKTILTELGVRKRLIHFEKRHFYNVSHIPENNLCLGCGICEAVCGDNAISFDYNGELKAPKVDQQLCTGCDKCLHVCPGDDMRGDIKSNNYYDKYLGKIEKSYVTVGSSNSTNNRYTASGGFTNNFLSYLLDNKIVNGVINVALEGKILTNAKSQLITESSNLLSSSGSLYFPVPLGDTLKIISKMDGKFVVVGLPCQIRAINRLSQFDEFKDKIILTMGAFCGFMIGYPGGQYLLDSFNIKDDTIDKISYRADNGGKDGFLVESNGNEYFKSRSEFTSTINRTFSNKRCLMCNDMTAEDADISCGDAHGYGYNKSLAIARTKFADKLIKASENANYITIEEELNHEEVFNTQRKILKYKKETLTIRLRLMKIINKHIPSIPAGQAELFSISKTQYLGTIIFIINVYLTKNKLFLRSVYKKIPTQIMMSYGEWIYSLLQGKSYVLRQPIISMIKFINKK